MHFTPVRVHFQFQSFHENKNKFMKYSFKCVSSYRTDQSWSILQIQVAYDFDSKNVSSFLMSLSSCNATTCNFKHNVHQIPETIQGYIRFPFVVQHAFSIGRCKRNLKKKKRRKHAKLQYNSPVTQHEVL